MLSHSSKILQSITRLTSNAFASAVHTPICIIGAGSGGISVTAQLIRKGVLRNHIRIFDPSKYHHYQPGWTQVAGGLASPNQIISPNDRMIPTGVPWTELAVTRIDPENNTLETEDGKTFTYNHLVIAAGMQNDLGALTGLSEALNDHDVPVGTVYDSEFAQKWRRILQNFNGKTVIFTHPKTAVKLEGASQNISFLTYDYLKAKKSMSPLISCYTAAPTFFPQENFSEKLEHLAYQRGLSVFTHNNLIEIKPKEQIAILEDLKNQENVKVHFDALHVTPPQTPHKFLESIRSLVNETGFVDVHPNTLRSTRYNNIWSLGDCTNLPTLKTVTATVEQTPILVYNLMQALNGNNGATALYSGYTACPLFVGGNKLLLSEFKYNLEQDNSFGFLHNSPRSIFYHLQRNVFPFAYFNLMPKGLWIGSHGIVNLNIVNRENKT